MPLLAFYCNASLLPQYGKYPGNLTRTWRRGPEKTKRYTRNNASNVRKEGRQEGGCNPRDFKPVILILEKPATE